MKSFKISNLVTKTLFSSEKTKKLIDGGVQIRAGSSEIILSKNERAGWGGWGGGYSGPKSSWPGAQNSGKTWENFSLYNL